MVLRCWITVRQIDGAVPACNAGIVDGRRTARERIAERLVPRSIGESFRKTREAMDEELGRLGADLQTFDPTLAAALEKSGAKIRYQLEKLSRKATRERLRRDRQALDDAEYLIHTIYPERHLQERFYTILPFLAEHGLDLVGRLLNTARTDCPDHMVRGVRTTCIGILELTVDLPTRWSGGTGRRTGLKIPRPSLVMWVRPPPPAPFGINSLQVKLEKCAEIFFALSCGSLESSASVSIP